MANNNEAEESKTDFKEIAVRESRRDVQQRLSAELEEHLRYERYLLPAPAAIELLGHLALLQANEDVDGRGGFRDFELTPPPGGFAFVKWPKSFRASLLQVAHAGLESFTVAHNSMDRIRIRAKSIPANLTDALQIIASGDLSDIERQLPIILDEIKESATQCQEIARRPLEAFNAVFALLKELSESATNTKDPFQRGLTKVRAQKEALDKRRQVHEENQALIREELQSLKQDSSAANKLHLETLASQPGAVKLLCLVLADHAVDVVSGISKVFGLKWVRRATPEPAAQQDNAVQVDAMLRQLQNDVAFVNDVALKLVNWVQEEGQLAPPQGRSSQDAPSEYAIAYLKQIKANLSYLPVRRRTQAVVGLSTLCDKALDVCIQLAPHIDKRGSLQIANAAGVAAEIGCLQEAALQIRGMVVADVQSWLDGGEVQSSGKSKLGYKDTVLREKHGQIAATQQAAENLQQRFDDKREQSKGEEKQFADLIVELRQLDLREIDFEGILSTLQEGLKMVQILEERWSELTQFFEMIANHIEGEITNRANSFVRSAAIPQIGSAAFARLYRITQNAVGYSTALQLMTEGYVQISYDHFLPLTRQLSKLCGAKDSIEIEQTRVRLASDVGRAQDAIEDTMRTKQAEFAKQMRSRLLAIETSVDNR